MLINEIFNNYTLNDWTTVELLEQSSNWMTTQTTAYKKGLKIYSRNAAIMNNLSELLNFIKQHNSPPATDSYPPKFNVHMIPHHKYYSRELWAHLRGQNIGLLFSVEPGVINLRCIGTHDGCGI